MPEDVICTSGAVPQEDSRCGDTCDKVCENPETTRFRTIADKVIAVLKEEGLTFAQAQQTLWAVQERIGQVAKL